MNEKSIHWFPGHMQKATRKMVAVLKIVDIIVELVDARAPMSSRNQNLASIIKRKPNLLVLTKADYADPQMLIKERSKRDNVLAGNLHDQRFIKQVSQAIIDIGVPIQERQAKRGLRAQPLKVLVVGIPNVGKSTLINKLAGRRAAGVENRPGFTRDHQYIKVNQHYSLIDTPGILPPNYDDESVVIKLALLGSIRQEILPISKLAQELMTYLHTYYLNLVLKRYGLTGEYKDNHDLFMAIASARGIIGEDAHVLERSEILVLNDFKNGQIGLISLEGKDE